MSPVVRLIARDLLAGLYAFAVALQQAGMGSSITQDEFIAACIAGLLGFCVLAGAELGTPLNKNVGVGKDAA